MTKDQMKAAIDELNEEHSLELKYDEDASGKELKALLKEANKRVDAKQSGEPEDDVKDATPDAEAEGEDEAEESDDAPIAPAEKPEARGNKQYWPKGWKPTGDKVADTKVILDNAPKVSFLVPRVEGEDPRVTETVQINGYKYEIKKGHMVSIPRPVADLLARKYQVQMEVAERATAASKPELQG